MKIGLEKKKLPNSLKGYLLTLLLVLYFMANPLATIQPWLPKRPAPGNTPPPPSLVGDFDQNEKLAA
jgi:hypothetical protein